MSVPGAIMIGVKYETVAEAYRTFNMGGQEMASKLVLNKQ